MRSIENRLLNRLWRRKFQRGLRDVESFTGAHSTLDNAVLWARIAGEIESIPTAPRDRHVSMLRNPMLYSLLAASIGFLCLFQKEIWETRSMLQGIKSADTGSPTLPSSLLAFAILKTNGEISRGSEASKLKPEEAVIFYIETPGLFQGTSFTLDILVQTPDGKQEKIVDHYRVQSSAETLKGQLGFIVYKPEIAGIHRFYGMRAAEKSSEKVPGFSIERLN